MGGWEESPKGDYRKPARSYLDSWLWDKLLFSVKHSCYDTLPLKTPKAMELMNLGLEPLKLKINLFSLPVDYLRFLFICFVFTVVESWYLSNDMNKRISHVEMNPETLHLRVVLWFASKVSPKIHTFGQNLARFWEQGSLQQDLEWCILMPRCSFLVLPGCDVVRSFPLPCILPALAWQKSGGHGLNPPELWANINLSCSKLWVLETLFQERESN